MLQLKTLILLSIGIALAKSGIQFYETKRMYCTQRVTFYEKICTTCNTNFNEVQILLISAYLVCTLTFKVQILSTNFISVPFFTSLNSIEMLKFLLSTYLPRLSIRKIGQREKN